MNHERITDLLTQLKAAGLTDNTVEAFSNVIKDQGYNPGPKVTPEAVEEMVAGIYVQYGLENKENFNKLVAVKKIDGEMKYQYLASDYSWEPCYDSFLGIYGEKWQLLKAL